MPRPAAIFVSLLTLAAPAPARAQLAPSEGALSVLALFGLAPHLARDHAHFAFNVVFPAGHTMETTLFEGLDGVPSTVETSAWGVRPTIIMQGRFVGLNASVQFDFGSSSDVGDGVTFERTFGVTTRYHNGFNLTGFFSRDPAFMLTVGPTLDASIGPRLRIEHEDGSHAQWGRIGEVQLAPSLGFAMIRGPVRMWALGALYLEGQPWALVNASTGEADGRWDIADPEAPQHDPEYVGAKESLQRIDLTGGSAFEAGVTVNLGDARYEPRLSLGVTAAVMEKDYSVADNGFGVSDAFTERDMRVMISVGIAMPQGTL